MFMDDISTKFDNSQIASGTLESWSFIFTKNWQIQQQLI